MLDSITKFVFMIINAIANIFTGIILDIIQLIIPELAIPFQKITLFFNTYVWDMLFWIRRVMVNVLCFPNDLFHFLIGFYSIKVLLTEGMRITLFVYNMYRLYKGQNTISLITNPQLESSDAGWDGWYKVE